MNRKYKPYERRLAISTAPRSSFAVSFGCWLLFAALLIMAVLALMLAAHGV